MDLRPGAKGTPTLVVYDAQLQEERKWLGDQHVTDAAWSPSGSFLAVIVVDDAHNYGIQILDRLGRVVQEWWQPLGSEVFCLRWDPAGQRLAYLVDDGEHIKLVVGYVPGKADLSCMLGRKDRRYVLVKKILSSVVLMAPTVYLCTVPGWNR